MCRCQAANDDLWKGKGHTAAEWVSLKLDWLLKTLYLVKKEREEGNVSITCLLAGDTEGVVSQSDLPLARHTLSQRRKWIFHQLNCASKPPEMVQTSIVYIKKDKYVFWFWFLILSFWLKCAPNSPLIVKVANPSCITRLDHCCV